MKVLLHACCGPCAMYPLEVLLAEGFDITGYFYNPNIHPAEEFQRRQQNAVMAFGKAGVPLLLSDAFDQNRWESFQGDETARCRMCYAVRMEEIAALAAREGFSAFTTTLLVSPYQQYEVIVEAGQAAAARHGIGFLEKDFRPGFRQGQNMARECGLYRQKYCGCIRSLPEKLRQKTENITV